MDPEAVLAQAASGLRQIEEASTSGQSDIQKFFSNSTVFITGGSGFIGKQLMEKLFRSCNIKRIYMLLRSKKKKAIEDRLMETLKDPVFEAVRKLKPDFADRIKTVEGDVSELNLGICEQDWNIMTAEVDVIFHVAATTRFDEHIQDATFINVRGTRETLRLGQACRRLKSLVHVSTAYCHATSSRRGGELEEQFFSSPVPPDTLLRMAETVDRTTLQDITSQFIRGWPNTYTFTKAVAEEQVRLMAAQLPVSIVRPSIVISSYREPCPAWLDMSCAFSASGFIIGSGLGLIHVMEAVKNTDMSLVPVDYVNNALITAAWEAGARPGEPCETRIYNMVTSRQNTIEWAQLEESIVKVGELFPTPLAIWKSFVVTTSSYYVLLLLSTILHYIPALCIDGVLTVVGKERRFIKLYKKIHKLTVSLSYFMTSLYKMDDRNLTLLKQKQSNIDSIIFNFDMGPLDWQEFIKLWCLGVRKYVLKDGLKNTDNARRKQFWYGVLNYAVLAVYCYAVWIVICLVV